MIWIYEHLSKAEIKKLEYLNPLMDYIKNNTDHLFNTHCTRLEIRDGQVQDVRKAKFFKVDQTKKGFICDNFIGALADSAAYDKNITDMKTAGYELAGNHYTE